MANYNQLVYYTKALRAKPTSFALADGTSWKTVFTPSDPASRVVAIPISTICTTARILLVRVNDTINSVTGQIGYINIPAYSGTNGVVPVVSGLNRGNLPWLLTDAQGNPFIDLNYGMTLEMRMYAALSGSDTVDMVVFGGDYTE